MRRPLSRVGDENRVSGIGAMVNDPRSILRPLRVGSSIAQERLGFAAHGGDNPHGLIQDAASRLSLRYSEPDLLSVAGETEIAVVIALQSVDLPFREI